MISAPTSPTRRTIALFGAYGHTAHFVVRELRKRGLKPILSGRDAAKLKAVAAPLESETRVACVNDPASLDRALAGAAAVINCAGPFIDTAAPVIEAALRTGIHYLDIAAEQAAVLATFERYPEAAIDAGIVVLPAMGFYGGLGDLLATAAMGNWIAADEINVAVALDSWQPTSGTRVTGQRNPGLRFYFSNNRLERSEPPPPRTWNFPEPFGKQNVVSLSLAETITISRHLRTPEIRAYMNPGPLSDLRDPNTPPPTPADESGRSAQIFVVEVVVRRGNEERRAIARGRDIYAVTAPIVSEAVERILDGHCKAASGTVAPGQIFDAQGFLDALSPQDLTVEFFPP
jgi:short subunit dehydrogenase-like uncharacterized protein